MTNSVLVCGSMAFDTIAVFEGASRSTSLLTASMR